MDSSDGEPASYKIFSHAVNRYDGNGFAGLAPGSAGKYGALSRSERLSDAYGTGQLIAPSGRLARTNGVPATLDDELGYRRLAGAGYVTGFYIADKQQQFDFQSGGTGARGLMVATRDRLDHEFAIAFDAYNAFPAAVTNPIGLTKTAEYNYRVLKISLVTDYNSNRTKIEYSPNGLVTAIWLMGKAVLNEGDRARASTQYQYDLRAYLTSKLTDPANPQPAFVRSVRYTHHDTDPDDTGGTIETYEYTDGFGRSLQTRSHAEDAIFGEAIFGGGDALLPLHQNDPGPQVAKAVTNTDPTNPNVIVSGWQRYDNKGRVVEKREFFVDRGWKFAAPANNSLGHKAALFYDPRGQMIRTVNPDGSERRVLYGIPGDLNDPSFAHRPWSVNCEGRVEVVERHVAIPAVLDMEDHTDIADAFGRPRGQRRRLRHETWTNDIAIAVLEVVSGEMPLSCDRYPPRRLPMAILNTTPFRH